MIQHSNIIPCCANELPSDHGLSTPAFPLNPPKKVEATAPDDLLSSVTGQASSDEPVEAYYPGTEISGFMPHRGDFATVSDCTYCCICIMENKRVHFWPCSWLK